MNSLWEREGLKLVGDDWSGNGKSNVECQSELQNTKMSDFAMIDCDAMYLEFCDV